MDLPQIRHLQTLADRTRMMEVHPDAEVDACKKLADQFLKLAEALQCEGKKSSTNGVGHFLRCVLKRAHPDSKIDYMKNETFPYHLLVEEAWNIYTTTWAVAHGNRNIVLMWRMLDIAAAVDVFCQQILEAKELPPILQIAYKAPAPPSSALIPAMGEIASIMAEEPRPAPQFTTRNGTTIQVISGGKS